MTTLIADTKNKCIYADTKITTETRYFTSNKLFKFKNKKDEFILAISGDCDASLVFIRKFKKAYKLKLEDWDNFNWESVIQEESEYFEVLILNKNGCLLSVNDTCFPYVINDSIYITGSGSTYGNTLIKYYQKILKKEVNINEVCSICSLLDDATGDEFKKMGFS
jgi:hypothetical protein